MIDHYRVLGVTRDADTARIREAYLRLARQHHPDRHLNESEAERRRHVEAMQAANRAWAVLGDADARADHDRELESGGGRARATDGPRFRMPKGASWRPRADDTAWMDDYGAWRDEDERLPEDPPGRGMGPVAIVPSLLMGIAVIVGFTGTALSSRPLLAIAFAAGLLSVLLFVLLSIRELGRSRAADRTGGHR